MIFRIEAHIPRALWGKLMQHIRDFDTQNEGCHFEMFADARGQSVAEVLTQLRKIEPALPFETIIPIGAKDENSN